MVFEKRFMVGVTDVDFDERINNKAIIEKCSDAATLHTDKVEKAPGGEQLKGLGWVVLHWKLEVYFRPAVCEDVTVRTWSVYGTKLMAHRDCEMLDSSGKICAKLSSVWAALDKTTGLPVRLREEYLKPFGSEPDRQNFPDWKPDKGFVPDLPEAKTEEVRVMRHMIDVHRHVHNSYYVAIANEALPSGVSQNDYDSVEIVFKKEIQPGSLVRVGFIPSPDADYAVIDSADGNVRHAVLIMRRRIGDIPEKGTP